MIDQTIIISKKQHRIECVLKSFAEYLPIIALVIACTFNFFSQILVSIEQPVILIFGALFILLPLRSEAIITLQKIIGFYLFCVIVNQFSLHYFSFSFMSLNTSISYSAIVLSLCATGYILGKVNSSTTQQENEGGDIISSWILALSIVIIHIILLSLILNKFYGYGYERNLNALGNLCLYFLLFIVLWNKFDILRFRLSTGLILAIYSVAIFNHD